MPEEIKYMEHIACGEVFEQFAEVEANLGTKQDHLKGCEFIDLGRRWKMNLTEEMAF